MKAQRAPVSKSPAVVYATGHLLGVAHGIMEGDIEFPIRGILSFRLERMEADHIGERAKLICLRPYSECVMVMIRTLDEPDHWHGFLVVEGYHFMARAQRFGKKMTLTFFDVKQPVWGPEARALLGKVA